MAGAIAQSKAAFSTAGVTSIGVTFAGQTAGNAIWAVGHDGAGSAQAITCADTANGNYGTQLDSVADTTNGNTVRHWVKGNIASGSNTITASFPGTDNFSGIYAAEVSGVATAPTDGHHGNTQASLASGGTVSSGAATSTATAVMLALTIQDSSSSAGHATVGAGFTVDPNFASGFWNLGTANGGIAEFKASVAAGSNTGTFTNGTGLAETFNTVMVMLDEATSGATGSAVQQMLMLLGVGS